MADIKNVLVGESESVSIYKNKRAGGGHVFSWPLQIKGKESMIIVKPDYSVVVMDIAGEKTKIEMRKVKMKKEGREGEFFFVGRNGSLKISLMPSSFYEDNTSENPQYYPFVALLDAEELKEAEENDAKFAHVPVDVDFWDDDSWEMSI